MRIVFVFLFLAALMVAALPRSTLAQTAAPCPDTHYQCSPGVCCPR
jgi:hypothetical protein